MRTKYQAYLAAPRVRRVHPQQAPPPACMFWDGLRARLAWMTEGADLDLLVREPDGQEFSCFATGPTAPNGTFSCDAPSNGLMFEQYTWRALPASGQYCFSAVQFTGTEAVDAVFEILGPDDTVVFGTELSVPPGQVVDITCVTQCRRPGAAEVNALDCALSLAPAFSATADYQTFVQDLLSGFISIMSTLTDDQAQVVSNAFCSAIAAAPAIEDTAEFASFALSLMQSLAQTLAPVEPIPTPTPTPTPIPTPIPTATPTPIPTLAPM